MRACAAEFRSTFHKRLYMEIDRKNAAAQIEPRTQTHTLCKPGQSKCRSTFHKSHFIRTEIYRKNAAVQLEHPDQAPAFASTVRSPQCEHTVWGKIMSHSYPQLRVYLDKKTTLPIPSRCQISLGKADAVSLHAEVGHCSGSLQCLDSCCQ